MTQVAGSPLELHPLNRSTIKQSSKECQSVMGIFDPNGKLRGLNWPVKKGRYRASAW